MTLLSRYRLTRRRIQLALGALWLLDGLLQLQPFMFTGKFASQIIAPTSAGQPHLVAATVGLGARVIGAHPAVWNSLFAAIQLGLGIGLLWRPTVRIALAGSVAWGLGVWVLGEGLGGLAGGHAALLTGAPGAALLYAVVALGVWPSPAVDAPSSAAPSRAARIKAAVVDPRDDGAPAAGWLRYAWAVLWVGAAAMELLPTQASGSDLAGQILGSGATGWIGAVDRFLAAGVQHAGLPSVLALSAVQAAIGLSPFVKHRLMQIGLVVGLGFSAAFWVVGQSMGQLSSGMATDPNSAIPVILLGLVVLGIATAQERPVAPSLAARRWDLSLAGRRPTGTPPARRRSLGLPATPVTRQLGSPALYRLPTSSVPRRSTGERPVARPALDL